MRSTAVRTGTTPSSCSEAITVGTSEKEHWQKFTPWRASTRVPLIIRVPKGAPGLPQGTTPGGLCDQPVSLVHLFGTLTDLCGLPAKEGIESRSLAPLLRDPAATWPHAAITHLEHPDSYAISTQRWRYIHYRGGGEELYDIHHDPHEWTNLASKPEHSAKLAEMRSLSPKSRVPIHETQPGINDFEAGLELVLTVAGEAPPSKISNARVTLMFLNKRQQAVSLVPLDENGKRREPVPVVGASRWLVQTFAGQTWLVLDEEGKPLGHISAPEMPARVFIH